ncbi:MAG: alpha-mannosidase [Pirellulales bacterium]|nr:alpha-mannosidase [Pirellulales bacterium]
MPKPKIHLICNAHLDPVWQWRWEEGCSEALSTFRNAVQLLHEHGALIFNHNEAILYQWVQKYDPALFREIQSLARKGRWAVSGGWFLQPDANLPGTESLIRQILSGRAYFKEYFQVEPRVACNYDSFGHSGGLPQILRLAGYEMYVHMRPQQDDLAIPSDFYRWRGIDGAEIPAYRISVGLYHTEFANLEQRLREGTDFAIKQNRDIGLFWGIGDHGGGATRKDLETIDRFIERESRVEFVHSTTDRLCESLRPYYPDAPLVETDLQRVFTGCYTSLSRVKRAAAKSLAEIVQTEALRTALWWIYDAEYPEIELAEIWKGHLFNDFHDILPGTCIEPAERDALALYHSAEQSTRRLRLEAAVAYAQRNPLENAYLPVTVLNTNPLLKLAPVEFECMFDYRPAWEGEWHLQLYHPDGAEIPCQEEQPEALLPFHDWRRKISFYAELPAVGAATFRVKPVAGKKPVEEKPPCVKYALNPQTGFIEQLFWEDRQCLAGPLMKPVILNDFGDSWGTGQWNFRQAAGEVQYLKDSFAVLEAGPIRSIAESIFEFQKSKFIYRVISYSRLPAIEFRIRIHWNEERKHLKLSIPTIFDSPGILCDVPGGSLVRPADGEQHVHGRWFIAEDGVSAIGVVNDGQHGIDFHRGEARISVLRSAAYCHEQGKKLDRYPYRKFMDQGVHDIRLLVAIGSPSRIKESITAYADFWGMPPVAYPHLPLGCIDEATADGPPPRDLLCIDDKNVRLLAIRKSPDSDEMLIRFQETMGRATTTLVAIAHLPTTIALSFKPYEIKTLAIRKSGEWRERPLC